MKKILMMFCAVLVLSGCGNDFIKPTAGTSIVMLGDSLTAGIGATEDNALPDQIGAIIGEEVINSGVSGDTTADALARIEEDVLDHDPRVVIVLLGGNDALQRVDPDEVFTNLEMIIDRVQGEGAGVILVGIRGGLHNAEYKRRFRELAENKGAIYEPDILKGIFRDKSLMADGIHPNDAGYKIMAERLAPLVQEMLE